MKIRLGIFVLSLLLFPLLGSLLSGVEWNDLFSCCSTAGMSAESRDFQALLLTALVLLGCISLINYILKLRNGNSPFAAQRGYFLVMAAAGAVLGWLLVYLNLFAGSWSGEPGNSAAQILLRTLLFSLLLSAVLSIRGLLGSFTNLLKFFSRNIALPAIGNETLVLLLIPMATLGLLGGAVWPEKLFWLMWLAPLFLLISLQLFWNEGTIFSNLKSGGLGRLVCAALSGLVLGNLAVICYRLAGGNLQTGFHNPLFVQLGYAVFGLLCLQLGDVMAENWRGKGRGKVHQKKKKFPIQVVSERA